MLRVIYRREFHIYLIALYAPKTRQAYFDAFGSNEYAATKQGGRVTSASYVQYNALRKRGYSYASLFENLQYRRKIDSTVLSGHIQSISNRI
jgi:hypothetical protein